MTIPAWVWLIINWISLPVLAALGGILWRRKLYREFPFFFLYVAVTLIASIVRIVAQFGTPRTYSIAYWITDLVIAVFSFLSVYELFVRRLFPAFYRIRVFRYLFATAATALIFLGWVTAFESPNAAAALAIAERVLDSVLVGMLVFFVLLMILMGRQWTRHDFGIAFGFAIYAAAFLFISALWVRALYRPTSLDALAVIAYDIGAFVWLYCFWSVKPSNSLPMPDVEIVQQARTWERVLKQWLMPKKNLF